MADAGSVYEAVIKNVIEALKPEFQNEGNEQVLNELTQLWITKLMNSRAVNIDPLYQAQTLHSTATQYQQSAHLHQQHSHPVQTLSHMHQGIHLPQQHTPIPAQGYAAGQSQPQQQHFAGFQQQEYYMNRPSPSAASLPAILTPPLNPTAQGRPRAHPPNRQAPPQQTQQYPQVPQNDGADESQPEVERPELHLEIEIPKNLRRKLKKDLPQFDGEGDDEEEEGEEGESEQENGGGNEESLDSDLDSPVEENVPGSQDLVVCLFEKVTRAKTKWRCVLKDGVMRLNGRDHLFHKNTGEFDWV